MKVELKRQSKYVYSKYVYSKNNGFTLVEVLISVFIMSIIIMIVLPVFTSIMEAKSRMDSNGARQTRDAQALMGILQRDLKSAFLSKSAGEDKFIIRNIKDLDGVPVDGMFFSSYSHYMMGKGASSDQCEVGYFIKSGDDGKKVLYRKESKIIDDDLIEGGEKVKLTDSIAYFDIVAYNDGFSTVGEFGEDIEEPTLTFMPRGVLVKFGLIAGDNGADDVESKYVQKFEAAFELPDYGGVTGDRQFGGTKSGDSMDKDAKDEDKKKSDEK